MFNGYSANSGLFEGRLNEYKSVQVTRIIHDFYETDPRRGFYGGGALDARMIPGPLLFALDLHRVTHRSASLRVPSAPPQRSDRPKEAREALK